MAALTSVYQLKPAFQRSLRPLAGWLWRRGVSPDAVTVAGVATAGLAGVITAASSGGPWLLAVPTLYLVRMALNAIDGILAREHAAPTARGRWLNEAGDIAGDGLAYLPFTMLMPDLTSAALLVAVVMAGMLAEVTSIVATASTTRPNHGPFGKSDRAVAFGVLAVTLPWLGPVVWVLLAVLAILAIVTIKRRVEVLDTEVRP